MSAASKAAHLVHYRTVEVAGAEIFYREAGDPHFPTLLLLHGFPTSSHMFRDLIPLLADRYHLIAPDYPGFGYSSTPKPSEFTYTFDRLADVMEQFVDALCLTQVFPLHARFWWPRRISPRSASAAREGVRSHHSERERL